MTKRTDVYRQPQALAFLADICENPDDDTPRLIFADWLEENGDEGRAEFIRAQIERERLPTWSLRYRQLVAREKELTDEGKTTWLEALGDLRNVTCDHTFRRGFVEHVSTRPGQYMPCSDALFRRTPLRSLAFYHIGSSGGLEELAREPHLKRLRALSLSYSDLGAEQLPVLIAALESERLEELDLSSCGVGELSLEALRSAQLPGLKQLNLTCNPLLGGVVGQRMECLPTSLTELTVGFCGLQPEDLDALCAWPALRGLRSLGLSGNNLGGEEAAVALRQFGLAAGRGELTELWMMQCSLDSEALRAIGREVFGKLTTLHLGGNALGATAVQRLLGQTPPARMAQLFLDRTQLGEEGLTLLADWHGLAGVKSLDLCSNNLSESAFDSLFTSPHLGEPVELSFRHNNPSAAGIRALADCPKLGQLYSLDLNLCRLGDRRVEPLLTSPHLPNLRELRLHDNPIRKAMKAKLKARFPHGSI